MLQFIEIVVSGDNHEIGSLDSKDSSSSVKRNERRNGFISDPRIANNTTTAPAMIVVKLIVIIIFSRNKESWRKE